MLQARADHAHDVGFFGGDLHHRPVERSHPIFGHETTTETVTGDRQIEFFDERAQGRARVTLAGPTTLLAMLNSLHMGFRTLALEQQASEVWKVLGAVKTEFERYGEWVAKVREQVHKAADTLDKADARSKQMRRVLKGVEALPEAEALQRLPLQLDDGTDAPDLHPTE